MFFKTDPFERIRAENKQEFGTLCCTLVLTDEKKEFKYMVIVKGNKELSTRIYYENINNVKKNKIFLVNDFESFVKELNKRRIYLNEEQKELVIKFINQPVYDFYWKNTEGSPIG